MHTRPHILYWRWESGSPESFLQGTIWRSVTIWYDYFKFKLLSKGRWNLYIASNNFMSDTVTYDLSNERNALSGIIVWGWMTIKSISCKQERNVVWCFKHWLTLRNINRTGSIINYCFYLIISYVSSIDSPARICFFKRHAPNAPTPSPPSTTSPLPHPYPRQPLPHVNVQQTSYWINCLRAIVFPQVIQNNWLDIRNHLRVNHYLLSFFVSSDILDIEQVDNIMQVNSATWFNSAIMSSIESMGQ